MDQHNEARSGFDLDALQAQINMAMAQTEELVSSWVQTSKNLIQRPKRSIEDVEKELKEYLRRPPRLGVGAPIPEPVGPSAQEEAKLKNKLVGNDKKRRREDDTMAHNTGASIDEEEEETRKGESSTKTVRVDPFSLPKKKKAKHKAAPNGIEAQANATASSQHVANGPIRTTATPSCEQSDVAEQETSERLHEPSSIPKAPAVSSPLVPVSNGLPGSFSPSRRNVARSERPNPFTFPDKNDRKEHNIFVPNGTSPLQAIVPTLNGTTNPASTPTSNLGGSTQQQLPTPAPSQDTISPSNTATTTKMKKKKKKKKRKAGEDHVGDNAIVKGISQLGKSEDSSASSTSPTKMPTTGGTFDKVANGICDAEGADCDEYDGADLRRDERKDQSTGPKSQLNGIVPAPKSRNKNNTASVSSPRSLPGPSLGLGYLLNLTGPPPESESAADDDSDKNKTPSVQSPSSPSKKRKKRHRKKKKKHNLTGFTAK